MREPGLGVRLPAVLTPGGRRWTRHRRGPRPSRSRRPGPLTLSPRSPRRLSAARIGRSRSWTFDRLRFHATAGRVVSLRHGRWAAARGGLPVRGDDP